MTAPPDPHLLLRRPEGHGELLVNDYSRKGYVDGLVLRLPTICVRPGKPNRAASSFVSSIIREPLQGESALAR